MYVPRRHYRRLLLPPGWVALGFLLLLGCQVLLMNRRQLQLKNVLPLTMPLLSKIAEEKREKGDLSTYLFANPLKLIKTTTHWQDAIFIGQPYRDSVSKASVETMVLATQADLGHASGVRVRLGKGATYSSLVCLLDMMIRLNQKKYWLDIEHHPITFYVVNDKAVKSRSRPSAELTYY